jgi:poly(hydroxyalkanoate) granule-associated protein
MTSVALQTIVEAPAVANIRESANRIWLAGLGAFAKTQEESEKLFQALVKEGEGVEKRAKQAAEAQFEEAKGKVVEFRGKANEQFDHPAVRQSVARPLSSFSQILVDHTEFFAGNGMPGRVLN